MSNPPGTSDTSPPRRVAGGIGLVVKKKRKRAQSSAASTSKSTASVPSILSLVPDKSCALSSIAHGDSKSSEDEFGDDSFLLGAAMTNDTLLCLQSHTQQTSGMTSESCAYCPIFTVSAKQGEDSNVRSHTHAAPFLPKLVLVHLSSNHTQTSEDIKNLAAANKVRLLQLHGTAIARNGLGWRGDGNDDADIAVMETSTYEIAAKMALDAHFDCETKAVSTYQWFASVLLPCFCNETWMSTSSLESFIEETAAAATTNSKLKHHATTLPSVMSSRTVNEMNGMVKELNDAGLLLPKRGLGLNGGEGYWFSLPGLGKAAKSISDGRLSILRRIQASRFKEKKRSTIQKEINKLDSNKKKDNVYVQACKFLVLDLLAKGIIHIHETCTGEQYIRINQ